MADVNNIQAKIEESFEVAKTNARKGYLAYLGLIGKAVEQGQDAIEDLSSKRVQLRGKAKVEFDHLAARGETLAKDVQSKVDEVTAEQKAKFEEQKAALEERLQPVLDKIEELKARISREEAAA